MASFSLQKEKKKVLRSLLPRGNKQGKEGHFCAELDAGREKVRESGKKKKLSTRSGGGKGP